VRSILGATEAIFTACLSSYEMSKILSSLQPWDIGASSGYQVPCWSTNETRV